VTGVQTCALPISVASGIGESGKPPIKREPIIGDTGYHGDKETIVPARVAVTVTDRDDIKLSDFAAMQGNATIIFAAAQGGKVYTMKDATCAGDIQITGGEGETKLEFYGGFWTETTAAV
jgi:hypothetical protein